MTDNLKTRKILTYDDVVQYSSGDGDEKLVDVTSHDDSITTRYIKTDMVPITGEAIYVREAIARKLARIETSLREKGYRLKIAYGYRHPKVQRKYFEDRKSALRKQNPDITEEELERLTHNFVAVPDIAGHPAGAAVDLTLINLDGSDVDMGTSIADYKDAEMIKTFADNLTPNQLQNRLMLHDLMVNEGFAPFYGEWWHFSYGDREWAAFYNKKALYGAVDFQTVK